MSRLDFKLRHLLQKRSAVEGAAGIEQPRLRVLMRFKDELKPLEELGFETTSVAGDVAAGFATLDALKRIAEHPNVISVESSRPLKQELDTSAIEVNVVSLRQKLDVQSIPCRGEGVIVGVIDSGFDFTHPCFRTSAGDTRILAFWDQNQDLTQMPYPPPSGFNYAPPQGFAQGVEYPRGLIDAALRSPDPSQVIPHIRGNHGTRVASIAAGNGAPLPASYIGMAPKADLVFVSYDGGAQLGDSANAVDAINYIVKKAQEFRKPAVINISQGDSFGAHDGTSLLERAIESHLGQPGIAIVKSAGNEAYDCRHASGQVIQDQDFRVEFEISVGHDTETFDIWYKSEDRFEVRIQVPDGTKTTPVMPGSDVTLALPNRNSAHVMSQLNHPDNHDNRINIILEKGKRRALERGKWGIILIGDIATNGNFHMWIDNTNNLAQFTQPDSYWTVTIPGTSARILSVGAYVSKGGGTDEGDLLLSATSLGPTRDGRLKPDIAAPGFDITSAIVAQSGAFYRGEPGASGSSMSAPHVSGVIALLFQKDPTLTQDDIRNVLLSNAKTDNFTGIVPNIHWGYGKLDAEAAYTALSNFNLACGDTKKGVIQMNDQTRSTGVTIRTSDNGSNVVYITLDVRDGEIVDMYAGTNPGDAEYDVRNIKFTLKKKEGLGNDECKCCVKDPVTGRTTCSPCAC